MKNKLKSKIAIVLAFSLFAGAAYAAMVCEYIGEYCDYDNGCIPYYKCGPGK